MKGNIVPTYFVRESICEISRINQIRDPEWVAMPRADDGSYMVESKKFHITRYLAVFSQPVDAKKSFEECKAYFKEECPWNEKVNLWEVSALTRRGAAKKAFNKKGTLLNSAQIDNEALKKKKAEEAKGEILLAVLESGASIETLTEFSKKLDKASIE
jgi:hypothetical protein